MHVEIFFKKASYVLFIELSKNKKKKSILGLPCILNGLRTAVNKKLDFCFFFFLKRKKLDFLKIAFH